MAKTLRQALQDRRDEYLFRASIFDDRECPIDVDYRAASVRRFLAGGDDIDPSTRNFTTPLPYNRPPLLEGTEADDADYRLTAHDDDKSEDNRSDGSDYDWFAVPHYGQIDLNRITAQLFRAAESARTSKTPLTSEQVFDVRVSKLPLLTDTDDVLSKAFALLVLSGYGEDELKKPIKGTFDVTDWSGDAWDGDPGKVKLRQHLDDEIRGRLYKFIDGNRAAGQKCAREDPPAKPKPGTPPPPVIPEALPAGPADVMVSATEAFIAAFGPQRIEDFIPDLDRRGLGLSDKLIARLLLWLESSWDRIPDFMRPGIGTAEWRRIYLPPPPPPDPTNQSTPASPTGQDGHQATSPPAEEEPRDIYEGQREIREKWETIIVALTLLRFLGRFQTLTIRDACLRLHAMERTGLFWKMRSNLDKYLENAPPQWPYPEGLTKVMCTELFSDPAYSRPDLPFLITASMTDAELFKKRFLADASEQAPLLLPQATLDPLGAFYWRHVVRDSTFKHILGVPDTADFHVADHLRFLGLFRPGGRMRPAKDEVSADSYEQWMRTMVPQWFVDFAIAALLKFKYWIVDPKTDRPDEEEMNFWSENHQILFASSEYIAGDWFKDHRFKRTQELGSWHKARAETRMRRWLHDRLRFGFCELNSPVYYNEHLPAIINMVDFVEDEKLRKLAVMVLDLMVFDIVRRTCQGSFLAATSRVYSGNKTSGWAVSIIDFVQLITGTLGDYWSHAEATCVFCITSRYMKEIPEALLAIPHDVSVPMIDRSRVSINMSEAKNYGIGFDSGEDAIFWWGHSAYFTEETYRLSQSWSVRWHLRDTSVFKLFNWIDHVGWRIIHTIVEAAQLWAIFTLAPLIGPFFWPRLLRFVFDAFTTFLDLIAAVIGGLGLDDDSDRIRLAKTMIEQEFQKIAMEINAGSVNEREHFVAWRAQDAMLSSLVDEQFGKLSFQKEVCIATLGPNVSVFVNKRPQIPKTGEAIWHGTVAAARGGVENFAPWETIPGALDLGGSAMPETGEVMHALLIPAFSDDILGADGPGFWFGQTSNPRVWQYENVSIAIYKPDAHQGELSEDTHAFWPWDAFDEVRTELRNNGRWVFGRRDRRFGPCTPDRPDPATRPSKETPWPTFNRREETPQSPGAGYIALFSAAGMKTTPASARGWGHKELLADGDDNIWITIVGDRSLYGSFDAFVKSVLNATLDVQLNRHVCSITLPKPGDGAASKGPAFKLTWKDGASLDGEALSTGDWPRFELKASTLKEGSRLSYGVNSVKNPEQGLVKFDETSWRIQATVKVTTKEGDKDVEKDVTLFVTHDFSNLDDPKRDFNELPVDTQAKMLHGSPETFAVATPARSVLGQQFRPHRRVPAGGSIPRNSDGRRLH
jgi:hypothetical protein